jgi:hypothetical protein
VNELQDESVAKMLHSNVWLSSENVERALQTIQCVNVVRGARACVTSRSRAAQQPPPAVWV